MRSVSYTIHRVIFAYWVGLSCVASEYATDEIEFACIAEEKTGVSAEMLISIVSAESELNKNFVDFLQNEIYLRRFQSFDAQDWKRWIDFNIKIENDAEHSRFGSNKWPQALVYSGYVQSFGLAQITPRTIIRVCTRSPNLPYCVGNMDAWVLGLFDRENVFLALAAIVVDYSKEFKAIERQPTIAVLATAYNVGLDYYLRKFDNDEINGFGRYVEKHLHANPIICLWNQHH